MAIDSSRILRFDTGIERIIQEGPTPDTHLPERRQFAPAADKPRARLEELLGATSLDRLLQAFLKPDIQHPEVMNPNVYQELIDQAEALLSEAAQNGGDPALADAAELLAADRELRGLLHTYRNLLIQA